MKAGTIILLRFGLGWAMALQILGCAKGAGSGSGSADAGTGASTPSAPDTSLTGNWQFEVTSTGTLPFGNLSGFVNEENGTDGSYVTTASLMVNSAGCFADAKVVDLQGFTKMSLSQLTSFPFNSQTITMGLSQVCTNVSLCGTYTIAGGCADKVSGTIIGTKYAQLDGTFRTNASQSPGLQVALTQAAQGTGQGGFQVSGGMTFQGASCLTSGTIDPVQSTLSGSAIHLVASTDAASGAQLVLDGLIDPAASTLTLNTVTLTGSSCLDSFSGSRLSLTSSSLP